MFPCMIARTSTTDVISSGMGGTRNGSLQLVIVILIININFIQLLIKLRTNIYNVNLIR